MSSDILIKERETRKMKITLAKGNWYLLESFIENSDIPMEDYISNIIAHFSIPLANVFLRKDELEREGGKK